MKKLFRMLPAIAALSILPAVTSCSDDDQPDTRKVVTVGFENTGAILAGPTSYGANLYHGATDQFTSANIPVTENSSLHIGVNVSSWSNEIDFYGGGLALSQWNIRSNTEASQPENWWYTFENQCSVYNLASTDGANTGAGANGSNTFLLAFGHSNGTDMSECSTMNFTNGEEFLLESVELCNSSYVWGCMMVSNPYGNNPDKNLEEAKGWFRVEFYGYDAQDNATNGGKPVEFYLADYRDNSSTSVNAISGWNSCDLSALGRVNKVVIDFKGSDTGTYGLNTPAYVCLDNLRIVTAE